MPSKPIELLPVGNPLAAADLIHVAQWNGATFDSRQHTLQDIVNFVAAASSLMGVDTVAGATYTFAAADNYRHKRFTNGGAIAATVPLNATVPIPVGTRIRITRAGGEITLTPAGGVTLRSRDNALKSNGLYAVFEIEKVGTDEWDVLGDVTV